MREHERAAGVLEDVPCPLTRRLRIEDHEGPAGLEDRQKSDDVVGRPLETHADDHVGAHPPVTEEARQPVGPSLELPVGVVLALALHGDGVGQAPRPLGDQVDDVRTGRRLRTHAPSGKKLLPLACREEPKVADRTPGLVHHGFEEDLPVFGEPLDRPWFEQLHVVEDSSGDAADARRGHTSSTSRQRSTPAGRPVTSAEPRAGCDGCTGARGPSLIIAWK